MNIDLDILKQVQPDIRKMNKVLNSPVPGSSIHKESLDELRDMNERINSIGDRLDHIESDSRIESSQQKKRFYLSLMVGSVSAVAAVVAACAAVWSLFHPIVP